MSLSASQFLISARSSNENKLNAQNIHSKEDSQENQIDKIYEDLPDYLWVTEISLPHLYMGNQSKLGDVIIKANANPYQVLSGDSVAFTWGPGYIQIGNNSKIMPWFCETHLPLIQNLDF